MKPETLLQIYERAALCRAFEEECARRFDAGEIKFPLYLSIGQEYIPATVATWCEEAGLVDRQIFVQHRAHSVYLSFGGDLDELVLELLGDARGVCGGMGGTNCIQSRSANLYGHDTLLGTQVPIAVGAAYGNRKPTICFLGDAAAEEDYALAALGWAATQRLPILFIVEDNNLSILTEKRVRRSWSIVDVARGFGMKADETIDNPESLFATLDYWNRQWPLLLNVSTTRLRWHSGTGVDNAEAFDRHSAVERAVSRLIDLTHLGSIRDRTSFRVREAWARHSAKPSGA